MVVLPGKLDRPCTVDPCHTISRDVVDAFVEIDEVGNNKQWKVCGDKVDADMEELIRNLNWNIDDTLPALAADSEFEH